MATHRQILLQGLQSYLPDIPSGLKMLDWLQDLGLVSDLAQTMADVPDCDLLRALNYFEKQ
jgi:hypothetical protein